ncbi:hypothetical protein CC86DRAFT_370896 [Ophiobolus disseminans]|uniref:Uncharacterized protein n=1 Tax=Ophiobolus disseminans TaxID=1469910 RepID=A0A6A6ZVM1_9PLEO|nr:hypothetical protein CC86DRAFT_370896 [Ophiobolus disseminans]
MGRLPHASISKGHLFISYAAYFLLPLAGFHFTPEKRPFILSTKDGRGIPDHHTKRVTDNHGTRPCQVEGLQDRNSEYWQILG